MFNIPTWFAVIPSVMVFSRMPVCVMTIGRIGFGSCMYNLDDLISITEY